VPSPCHKFIKVLEDRGALLRNYTQNIDTLESILGVQKVLQCHGSFATASCLQCKRQVPGKDIEQAIFAKEVPLCPVCQEASGATSSTKAPKVAKRKNKSRPWESDSSDDDLPTAAQPKGIMKPDITFFGEPLTDRFGECLFEDREQADLLLVIGTSLKVAPVSEILTHLPHSVPQILINKTPVTHVNPDVILLGDADGIIKYLSLELGWSLPAVDAVPEGVNQPIRVGDSHVWLFEGAEGGNWVERFKPEAERGLPSTADTLHPPMDPVSGQSLDADAITRPGSRARDETDDESREPKRPRVL